MEKQKIKNGSEYICMYIVCKQERVVFVLPSLVCPVGWLSVGSRIQTDKSRMMRRKKMDENTTVSTAVIARGKVTRVEFK